MSWQSRTELMFGVESVRQLNQAHVLIVGLGGVGAYAAEMLCRAGVGEFTLVDGDTVSDSNRNRQLVALNSTMGQLKTDVLAVRLRDINPDVKLHLYPEFLRDERTGELLKMAQYDYLVDAIDTLSPKVFLLQQAYLLGIPTVSSMGSGGKVDPEQVKICDIAKSDYCKLARMVRKRLHRLGIRKGITVVYSAEAVPAECIVMMEGEQNKLSNVGTVSYMPAVFGCYLASHIIRQLALPKK
ncbi:MAG TPA: tRNA threonylcarbamoyladenosine dehydratase [Paludibacteraceae bacterium]|nr:tRNA threonylcarbamoyladenosine dehydratase [Paludibacteraceae bacterium]HQB69311.1 tRNA threonylcarbamoyladenosine dehydratase [Paludibacteraceae bacterium]HRS68084.1 tRNA threonylcarbamoyladenosine dehydratase [Paludibacteraceae bacterium]